MTALEGSERCVPRTLVLTGHDYRSRLRATMHFIIDELVNRGEVRVFTPGISELLRLKRAMPSETRDRIYNEPVEHDGALCFAWRTLVHPFNPRAAGLFQLSRRFFELYRNSAPPILKSWAGWADTIIVESGFPVLFLPDLARHNPKATIIYFASDALETIGCDPYLIECLQHAAPEIAWSCILSSKMADFVPSSMVTHVVPQGIDPNILSLVGPSPFPAGRHAVSIGSMLFDPDFFEVAARAFPDVTFHIIGSQARTKHIGSNVNWYDVMQFSDLPSFMHHADFGIAPYRNGPGTTYLSDTSLKLIQYGMFALPAVCPNFAADGRRLRFGYEPGDAPSIVAAITAALSCTDRTPVSGTPWSEVAERMLRPEAYTESPRETEALKRL